MIIVVICSVWLKIVQSSNLFAEILKLIVERIVAVYPLYTEIHFFSILPFLKSCDFYMSASQNCCF